jgi:hypothetical protein
MDRREHLMQLGLKRFFRFYLIVVLTVGFMRAASAEQMAGLNGSNLPALVATESVAALQLRVSVDLRVELLSIIFRLAGYEEYNQGNVESYAADVDKQFEVFRNHPVVKFARQLRQTRKIGYDACMCLAVHLTDAYELQPRCSFEPWPESMDKRWNAESVKEFLTAARQFAKEAQFKAFVERHKQFYAETELRLRSVVEKELHLEWFSAFFGEHSPASFNIIPKLLGGGNFGLHYGDAAGGKEIFCVLAVTKTDTQGMPVFDSDMSIVIHEFTHSYANPFIDRHLSELRIHGENLFKQNAERMRSVHYGTSQIMLYELLTRACTLRYLGKYEDKKTVADSLQNDKWFGFPWIEEMSALLGDYEKHRNMYPTLETFSPRIVTFLSECASKNTSNQVPLACGGIGCQLDKDPKTGGLRIVKVLPKTPASQAGLSTGLIIRKIDETVVADKTKGEGVNLIRGAVGTKVRLEVFNPGQNKTKAVELTRQIIQID